MRNDSRSPFLVGYDHRSVSSSDHCHPRIRSHATATTVHRVRSIHSSSRLGRRVRRQEAQAAARQSSWCRSLRFRGSARVVQSGFRIFREAIIRRSDPRPWFGSHAYTKHKISRQEGAAVTRGWTGCSAKRRRRGWNRNVVILRGAVVSNQDVSASRITCMLSTCVGNHCLASFNQTEWNHQQPRDGSGQESEKG